MAALSKEYMQFYLAGREERPLKDRGKVDVDDLADQMMEGAAVRSICDKVAESIAAPLMHERERKEWIAENRTDIDDAGGNADEAYRHYMQGRKDRYAYDLEEDVIDAAYEDDEDEDDDDDEDDSP